MDWSLNIMVDKSDLKVYKGLELPRMEEILSKINKIKVGLIGDLCLDIHWRADMTKSELSRETPHFPLPVVEEWMAPGGGGNVVANLADLHPAKVYAISIIGNDWRGEMLSREMKKRNVSMQGIVTSEKRWTPTYCKPLRRGISDVEYEDPRLDFGNYQDPSAQDEAQLLSLLDQVSKDLDILLVADQLDFGVITPKIIEKIVELGKKGMLVTVDSRNRINSYSHVILKPNEVEGYRAVFKKPYPKGFTFEDQIKTAQTLGVQNKSTVIMTLGPRGCAIAKEGNPTYHVPAYEVEPPFDTCGAGDSFLSAFSCALATGAQMFEAAAMGNRASEVILKKINNSMTAPPEEIKKRQKAIDTKHLSYAAK
jgi:rfaE bifunctional protein kinase chain/domain